MSNSFPMVRLNELLTSISRQEDIVLEKMYPILGAHWYAKGLYIKDRKLGSAIQADKIYRVERGDFVYNRLFAWKGSFAIVLEEQQNCYVSNEFPYFNINKDRVESRYLWIYFSQSAIWDSALGLSSGGTPTSRNRLKEEKLLNMEIPLPPLTEQQRIVARIEELASRIEEARGLRRETEASVKSMLFNIYNKIIKDVDEYPMYEVAPLIRRPVLVDLSENYYELGIRSFGKGTFHKPGLSGASLGTKRIFSIETGDLLFNIVFAWEGAVAVAKEEDQGRVGSHRFLTCVPKKGVVTSPFLCFHFLTERGLTQLGEASPGSAGRNRTLGINALEQIKVPIPPIEKQIWFDSLLSKVYNLKQLQTETAAELDTLMPSVLDKAFKGEL